MLYSAWAQSSPTYGNDLYIVPKLHGVVVISACTFRRCTARRRRVQSSAVRYDPSAEMHLGENRRQKARYHGNGSIWCHDTAEQLGLASNNLPLHVQWQSHTTADKIKRQRAFLELLAWVLLQMMVEWRHCLEWTDMLYTELYPSWINDIEQLVVCELASDLCTSSYFREVFLWYQHRSSNAGFNSISTTAYPMHAQFGSGLPFLTIF